MDEIPDPGSRRREPLSILWRSLAAPQTLLVLLSLVAGALILGSLVPQIPPQARGDPEAWLAVQTGLLGRRNGLFQILHLYDLSHAFLLRLLLALAGLALFVYTVDAAEAAWNLGRGSPVPTADAAVQAGVGVGGDLWISQPEEQAWPQILDLIERRGFGVLRSQGAPDDPDKGRSLVAGRCLPLRWARTAAFGFSLLALICLSVSGTLGWRSGDWTPATGDVQAVGRGTNYAVRLLDGGQPEATPAEIAWLDGSTEVGRAQVAPGKPAGYRGLKLHLAGHVPEVTIRGWDEEGQPLVLQEEGGAVGTAGAVEILFPSAEAKPLLVIPNQDRLVALSFEPACGDNRPAVHLTAFRGEGAQEQVSESVEESGEVSLAGLLLEVSLAYRPVLRLSRQPGLGLALLSAALALAAVTLACILPSQVLVLTTALDAESGTRVRVAGGSGSGDRRWLHRLLSELSAELQDGD